MATSTRKATVTTSTQVTEVTLVLSPEEAKVTRTALLNHSETLSIWAVEYDNTQNVASVLTTALDESTSVESTLVSADTMAEVVRHLSANQKIGAIKALRDAVPTLGLLGAKNYVDKIIAQTGLGQQF